MGAPYTKVFSGPTALRVVAGDVTILALPFLSTATLHRFTLVQTGGADATTVRATLYNSKAVLRGSASSGGEDEEGLYSPSPDLMQVIPLLTNDGDEDGTGVIKRFWETGFPYINQDGSPSNRERKIYLMLDLPVGGGLTTWDLALGAAQTD